MFQRVTGTGQATFKAQAQNPATPKGHLEFEISPGEETFNGMQLSNLTQVRVLSRQRTTGAEWVALVIFSLIVFGLLARVTRNIRMEDKA